MAFSSDLHEPLEVLKGKGSSFILVPQSAFSTMNKINTAQNLHGVLDEWAVKKNPLKCLEKVK